MTMMMGAWETWEQSPCLALGDDSQQLILLFLQPQRWPFLLSGSHLVSALYVHELILHYLRKPISLISQSDVRYRGILAGIDPVQSTIQLSNGTRHEPKNSYLLFLTSLWFRAVFSMGTETRRWVLHRFCHWSIRWTQYGCKWALLNRPRAQNPMWILPLPSFWSSILQSTPLWHVYLLIP